MLGSGANSRIIFWCTAPVGCHQSSVSKHLWCLTGKTHPFRPLLTRENAFAREKIYVQWEQEWRSSTKGVPRR
jgi:hypothetical protein